MAMTTKKVQQNEDREPSSDQIMNLISPTTDSQLSWQPPRISTSSMSGDSCCYSSGSSSAEHSSPENTNASSMPAKKVLFKSPSNNAAIDFSHGLLNQVHKMQSLLEEYQRSLTALEFEKADNQQEINKLDKQLKAKGQTEERYKEEIWNLEYSQQELSQKVYDLNQHLQKSTVDQTRLERERLILEQELEQLKALQQSWDIKYKETLENHESEIITYKKQLQSSRIEKESLAKEVQDLITQHAAVMATTTLRHVVEEAEEAADVVTSFSAPNNTSSVTMSSNNAITNAAAVKTRRLEAETEALGKSLEQAQEIIVTMQQKLYKERQERNQVDQLLREAQETIEINTHQWPQQSPVSSRCSYLSPTSPIRVPRRSSTTRSSRKRFTSSTSSPYTRKETFAVAKSLCDELSQVGSIGNFNTIQSPVEFEEEKEYVNNAMITSNITEEEKLLIDATNITLSAAKADNAMEVDQYQHMGTSVTNIKVNPPLVDQYKTEGNIDTYTLPIAAVNFNSVIEGRSAEKKENKGELKDNTAMLLKEDIKDGIKHVLQQLVDDPNNRETLPINIKVITINDASQESCNNLPQISTAALTLEVHNTNDGHQQVGAMSITTELPIRFDNKTKKEIQPAITTPHIALSSMNTEAIMEGKENQTTANSNTVETSIDSDVIIKEKPQSVIKSKVSLKDSLENAQSKKTANMPLRIDTKSHYKNTQGVAKIGTSKELVETVQIEPIELAYIDLPPMSNYDIYDSFSSGSNTSAKEERQDALEEEKEQSEENNYNEEIKIVTENQQSFGSLLKNPESYIYKSRRELLNEKKPTKPVPTFSPSKTSTAQRQTIVIEKKQDSVEDKSVTALTRTMVGDWIWKYTRKVVGGGISENKHRRYFWIHPYTQTLYWSSKEPGSKRGSSSTKSALVESFVLLDQNGSGEPPSILIKTPARGLKIQCLDTASHHSWIESLKFLLMDGNKEELSQEGKSEPKLTRLGSVSKHLHRKRSRQQRTINLNIDSLPTISPHSATIIDNSTLVDLSSKYSV